MCCPFHDDKTASLIVSPASNLWHCMGACQAGGSVIDWVMKTQGVSFRLACELLQKDLGLVLEAPAQPVKRATTKKLASSLAADADAQTQLRHVIDYYHETLKQSPEALAYLEKRGLASAELIDRFKLGFANRTLGYRLPEKTRKAGAEVRGALQEIGILRESGHEHFNGSLVVPVCDEHGLISEVYGRKILDNLRPGTAYHLYLPGPHVGVWNVQALQSSREIILCEALIDAMTFWVHDLDAERGTLMVRQGKGKKDRMLPIGERALKWVEKYRDEVRGELATNADDGTLFLSHLGEAFTPNRLTQLVRDYVDAAQINKRGSCHLFRHTMATLMLENGADVRFIQAMLGHVSLETTQIYTQVSIRKLKDIHTATHPAKMARATRTDADTSDSGEIESEAAALLSALTAEGIEDDAEV